MGQDLAFDTVFQWCYNGTAIRIVFGVSGKYKKNIEWQPQFKSTDLDVSFFKYVEQCHLYARLQIGNFINDKNTPVAFRNDAVMQYPFICKTKPEIGRLYRVDVADKIRNTYIRCGQFFTITLTAMHPR